MKKQKKILVAALSLVLVALCAVGGTLAWLTDTTDTVTNTFTVGKVDITLQEHEIGTDGKNTNVVANGGVPYQLIPGATYDKDPVVEVVADSEDCYLFVKFEEKNNANNYITYTSNLTDANGWTKLEGVEGVKNVWYRVVNKTDSTKSWNLLQNNQITINGDTVTNKNMDTAATASLSFTAYAVQAAGFDTAAKAWAKLG